MNLQRDAETAQWTRQWLIAFQPGRSNLHFCRQEYFALLSVFCNWQCCKIAQRHRMVEWTQMIKKNNLFFSFTHFKIVFLCFAYIFFPPTSAWLNIHSFTIFINIGMASHLFLLFFLREFFFPGSYFIISFQMLVRSISLMKAFWWLRLEIC